MPGVRPAEGPAGRSLHGLGDGRLRSGDVLPDCDLFNTNTICAVIFGPSVNVSRVLPRLLADPRFHHYVIGERRGAVPPFDSDGPEQR